MFEEFHSGTRVKYGFTLFFKLLQPKSTRTIKLRSQNPFEYPIIGPKYLSNGQDLQVIFDGECYKIWSIVTIWKTTF